MGLISTALYNILIYSEKQAKDISVKVLSYGIIYTLKLLKCGSFDGRKTFHFYPTHIINPKLINLCINVAKLIMMFRKVKAIESPFQMIYYIYFFMEDLANFLNNESISLTLSTRTGLVREL